MAHPSGHCKTLPPVGAGGGVTSLVGGARLLYAVGEPSHPPARVGRADATWRALKMPTVTVEGETSFEVAPGTKLVLAIEDAGIDIMHRCGGNARCTTCRVQMISGHPDPMEDLERTRLEREASLGPDIRLACQVRVQTDLTVNVLGRAGASGVTAGPRPAD